MPVEGAQEPCPLLIRSSGIRIAVKVQKLPCFEAILPLQAFLGGDAPEKWRSDPAAMKSDFSRFIEDPQFQ